MLFNRKPNTFAAAFTSLKTLGLHRVSTQPKTFAARRVCSL
jgi:hypothetical protein